MTNDLFSAIGLCLAGLVFDPTPIVTDDSLNFRLDRFAYLQKIPKELET